MALGWEYILAESRTMQPIGKLRQCRNRGLTVDLNKSGSAKGSLKTSDPMSALVWPWSTCLLVQYTNEDHEPFTFWSGPISSRNRQFGARNCDFTAVGWFDLLMGLLLQEQLQFTTADAGAIVGTLLEKAALLDPRNPITLGTVELTQQRTISYDVDQNIGQAIIDLATLESGYDWFLDPITRELNILAKRGNVRRNVEWTFIDDGYSEHSNLSDLQENVDGTIANDIRVRGKYGSSQPGAGTDFQSQDQYFVHMEAPALSDVVDQNILDAYATGEIVYRSQPRVTYTMTPKSSADAKVPRIFRDFDIGDTTFLTARDGHDLNIAAQATRIFGVNLDISDMGVETLSNLQTTAG